MSANRPILLLAIACVSLTAVYGQPLSLNQVDASRPYVRNPVPKYRNFAIETYLNTRAHVFPYDEAPKAYYSSMGDYLTTGYDVYQWL